MRQLSQHLEDVHHVEPNETLLSYLASTAREVGRWWFAMTTTRAELSERTAAA